MRHLINRNGLLALIGVLFILALPGCGAQPAAAPGQTGAAAVTGEALTPEQINERWVQSMLDNDREAARTLTLPIEISHFSFEANFKETQHLIAGMGYYEGAFQSAYAVRVEDHRSELAAYSLWTFAKTRVCKVLEISKINDRWIVTGWSASTLEHCK